MAQNFGGFRTHHHSAAILLRKSPLAAWVIVGFAIFVFFGLVAVRESGDTGAYGRLIRNPTYDAQCSALSRQTLHPSCQREEPQGELEGH
jgi:hypothetical protein